MPIFMDRHDTLDTTPGAFAAAHQGELKVQSEYACNMLTYWFDEDRGTAFCLVEAPTAEAVQKMHREAHGLVPNEIIEVDPSAVAGFLGRVTSPKSAAIEPIREPGFRVIMFTDMADSAGITMALGDDAAFAVMKKHHEIIRHALLAHDGREVDRAGDGFLTCFASVSRAVNCAVTIQSEFDRDNRAEAGPVGIMVRIGMGAGEPVTDGEALFGSTVNLTARICAHAEPGQILVSHVIRELCLGKGFVFEPFGKLTLKGFPDPVEVDAVEWAA